MLMRVSLADLRSVEWPHVSVDTVRRTDDSGDRAGLRLDGRAAVVTGSGRGIGRAIAHGLAAHGAAVVVADLDEAAGATVADEITGRDGRAIATRVDVRNAESVAAMVDTTVAKWGSVDILVNNAGVATTQVVEDTSEADWRRVLDVNLTGVFLCCQAVLPHMSAQGSGKIVNVASVAAKRISFNAGASYSASKAGLLAFTRHLAYEVAGRGINVNAICPGPTLTPMMAEVADEETLRVRARSVPRGRLAEPDDQLNAVLFLVSDLADMVCGVALDVDGGALLGWTDTASYFERRRGPAAKEVPEEERDG
ncbi:MAG: glucose 1-dehydrogenase [Streptosporangiales bacterium]|nr:glucose 1-dehydrogenase [Streptosporangiales bacterium]